MRGPGQHLNVRRISRVSVLGLGLALTLAACGQDDSGSGSIISDLHDEAVAAGFDDQAVVLESGSVSEDDVLSALIRARACVSQLGAEVGPITRDYFGTLAYSFDLGALGDDADALAQADGCQEQHARLVQVAFGRLHPPPSDIAVAPVEACVRERGGVVEREFATFDELVEAVGTEVNADSVLVVCFREITSSTTVIAS